MNLKEELINNIKEWIKLDNELTKMKNEIREKNNQKKVLTQSLVGVMKNNSIDCFDIKGGALVYKQRKSRKAITGKYLLDQLLAHYKDEPDVAKELAKKVLDNRPEVIKEEISRKLNK